MKHIVYLFIPTFLVVSFTSSLALADDCSRLESNSMWVSGLKKLEQAIHENNDKQALIYGEGLLEICPRLPKLNYLMAQLYQKLGDESKTLYYLQSATRYTKEFVVDTEVLERMWTERVFAENPESKPENVKKLKDDLQSTDDRLQATESELQTSKATIQSLQESLQIAHNDSLIAKEAADNTRYNWGALMWTGVGITSVGIGLTIAGTVLIINDDQPLSFKPNSHTQARIEGKYIASWTMIGIGAATTVAGALMMGFGGYHYTHDNTLSFSLLPNNFVISGTF